MHCQLSIVRRLTCFRQRADNALSARCVTSLDYATKVVKIFELRKYFSYYFIIKFAKIPK